MSPEPVLPAEEVRLQEFTTWWSSLTPEERHRLTLQSIEEFVEGERYGSDAEVFGTHTDGSQEGRTDG